MKTSIYCLACVYFKPVGGGGRGNKLSTLISFIYFGNPIPNPRISGRLKRAINGDFRQGMQECMPVKRDFIVAALYQGPVMCFLET